MRKARLKNDGEGFYHVTSRCVDRTFRFNDNDKTHIVGQIKRMGRFCGVEIGTYAVMPRPNGPSPRSSARRERWNGRKPRNATAGFSAR